MGEVSTAGSGAGSGAPHGVDVPLRVELDALAVLGQVDGQLRHAQDRVVDPDQGVPDRVAVADRQPTADPQVAVQPRVQPGPAVRLQRDDLPARDEPVRVLFDAQVGAVGVGADDAKRQGTASVRRAPRDQRTGTHREVVSGTRPRVALGEFGEPGREQPLRGGAAHVERRR